MKNESFFYKIFKKKRTQLQIVVHKKRNCPLLCSSNKSIKVVNPVTFRFHTIKYKSAKFAHTLTHCVPSFLMFYEHHTTPYIYRYWNNKLKK